MYRGKLILIFLTLFAQASSLDELRLDALLNESKHPAKSQRAYEKLYESTKLQAYLEEAIRQAYLGNSKPEILIEELRKIDSKNELIKKIDILNLIEKSDYKNAKKLYYDFISKNDDFSLANAMSRQLLGLGLKNDALEIAEKYYKKYESPYALYLYLDMLYVNERYKDVVKLTELINANAEANNKADEAQMPYLSLRLNALKKLNMWDKIIRLDPNALKEHLYKLLTQKDFESVEKYTRNVPLESSYSLFLLYRYNALYELKGKKYLKEFYKLGLKLYEFSKNPDILSALAHKLLEHNKVPELLELAKLDESLAFKIFFNLKEYKRLSELFMQKANKSNNNSYYIEALIYEMLDNPKKFDYFKLDELVAKGGVSASLLNIYAYTLIDYKIDIDKGIQLVLKALKTEPNNAYYLDTLAWGYYLQKDCARAKALLAPIKSDTNALSEDEIKTHIKRIEKCKN